MLAARTKKITIKRQADPLIEDGQILARLVCYTSKLVYYLKEKYFIFANEILFFLGTFMCRKSGINCNGSCSSISC
jgi:hypothetical protein